MMFFRRLFASNRIVHNSAAALFIIIIFLVTLYFYYHPSFICHTALKLTFHVNDIFRPKVTPRIFCFIITAPQYFLTRVKAVNDTWGPRCDRYFFIAESLNSNASSELVAFANRLPIAPIPNIGSGYNRLTQKSTLGFLFAYEKYFNDCDWFVKTDDDTYLFVDHLKMFLSDKNTSAPVTYGYKLKTALDEKYHAGGAGYVLSREALRLFYQAHQESPSQCRKDFGYEDVEVANCLRTKGVHMGESLDKQNREYFHHVPFETYFSGPLPDGVKHLSENHAQTGYNCCSDQTISFHYVSPNQQYLIDFLLHKVRSKPLASQ